MDEESFNRLYEAIHPKRGSYLEYKLYQLLARGYKWNLKMTPFLYTNPEVLTLIQKIESKIYIGKSPVRKVLNKLQSRLNDVPTLNLDYPQTLIALHELMQLLLNYKFTKEQNERSQYELFYAYDELEVRWKETICEDAHGILNSMRKLLKMRSLKAKRRSFSDSIAKKNRENKILREFTTLLAGRIRSELDKLNLDTLSDVDVVDEICEGYIMYCDT